MTSRYHARLDRLEDALPFSPDIEQMIDRLAVGERLTSVEMEDIRADMRNDRRRFRGQTLPAIAETLAEELGCTPGELLDEATDLTTRYGL